MSSATVVIGERINSSNAAVRRVLADRDEEALLDLARRQIDGGATGIDINASMLMEGERDALLWAANAVAAETGAVVSLDSPDLGILLDVLGRVEGEAIVNSITCDDDVLDRAMLGIAGIGAGVVVMLKNREGIPADAEGRCRLAERAAGAAERSGILPGQIYFDPVFQPLATAASGLGVPLDAFALLGERFPDHRRIGGLSNVSFGLPLRKLVNRTCLAMAVGRGMDAVICDATDTRLMDALAAAEALAGRDAGCRGLIARYRRKRRD
ncbi:MAG: dihydropteroate synthase [Candidatus Krumholzibacteriota bacterium]|nr:dihydropteroate synthase [Candidatus Krumholzibacteriota bacterium]